MIKMQIIKVRLIFIAKIGLLLVVLCIMLGAYLFIQKIIHNIEMLEATVVSARTYPDDEYNNNYVDVKKVDDLKKTKVKIVKPISVTITKHGSLVYDFGLANFGAVKIKFPLEALGSKYQIILGEKINQTGGVWRPSKYDEYPLNIEWYEESSMLNSMELLIGGKQRFRPKKNDLPPMIKSIMPYRYVEVSGAFPISVEQLVVYYPMEENKGYFISSDATLNDVWNLSSHTIRSAGYSQIFVDGNRERKPYEADAYIAQLGYYALTTDNSLSRQTLNYLIKNPTWPTEWGFYTVFMAYEDYMRTSDKVYIKKIANSLKLKVFVNNFLITTKGIEGGVIKNKIGYQPKDLVDWPPNERDNYAVKFIDDKWGIIENYFDFLKFKGVAIVANIVGSRPAYSYYLMMANEKILANTEMPKYNTVINAIHIDAVKKLSYLLHEIGDSDAEIYSNYLEIALDLFQKSFINNLNGIFIDGIGFNHSSLHANMYPLSYGLVPNHLRESVIDFIVSKNMACSVYGSQALLDGLFDARRSQEAIKLLTNKGDRGWWSMKNIQGSTMTMESWNHSVKPDSDWSHAWGAVPLNIISRWLVGVRRLPDFHKTTVIDPQPGEIDQFDAAVPIKRGVIRIKYHKYKNNKVKLEIDLPKNMGKVTAYIPCNKNSVYKQKGHVESRVCPDDNRLILGDLLAGKHLFEITPKYQSL